MSKKILSVLLAVSLVLSVFAVSAFAIGETAYEDDATYTQTWALENVVDNNDGTYSVDVKLTANYVVGAIQFEAAVTSGTATLTGVAAGAALTADYNADISFNEAGVVAIIPDPTSAAASGIDLTAGGVIATLTYTVTGSAAVAIKDDAKSETNLGGGLIAVRLSDGNLTTGTMIYGQAADVTAATANFGAAATPELVLSGGVTVNTGYCNTAYTGVIFGFPKFGSEANYRTYVTSTLGDEYIVYEANADGKNGTGAVIKLVDANGNVLESYVVVVFGDVNGDGRITTTDTTYLAKNRTSLATSTGADKLAANVNGDNRHAVTTADTTFLAKNRTSLGTMQSDIAATY